MEKIAYLAQLAAVLEVCTDKPGNVTSSNDFHDTSYEDFLFSSIALGSAVRNAAEKGFSAGVGDIPVSEIGVGELIKKGIYDIGGSHLGGNTHLGMLMLFIPLAAGAGLCISKSVSFEKDLRRFTDQVIRDSTVRDSIDFYDAIKSANLGSIGSVGGICGPLCKPHIRFHELMEVSSPEDRIASELAGGMELTFEFSLATLENIFKGTCSIREAILQTYLILLSGFPDTLIVKKAGLRKAAEVSDKAKEILELRGIFTPEGRDAIAEFDSFLRKEGNLLNPGTTADLVGAALFVWFIMNRFEY